MRDPWWSLSNPISRESAWGFRLNEVMVTILIFGIFMDLAGWM
jgi:hypothetical protein